MGGLRVTLQGASFDGTTLRGRILLGSASGARVIRIRPTLLGGGDVEVGACDAGTPLPLRPTAEWSVDVRESTEIVVPIDTWYGQDFALRPFREPVSCASFALRVPVDLPDRSGHGVLLELRAHRGGAVELLRAAPR